MTLLYHIAALASHHSGVRQDRALISPCLESIMATANEHASEPKSFTPKDPPKLDPPKDDPISLEDLAKCDGAIT